MKPKNDLIIPACIVAAAIVVGLVLQRVLPSASGRPVPPPDVNGPSSVFVPDSANASFVKSVDGGRARLYLSPGSPHSQREIDLLIADDTSFVRRDGRPWTDRTLMPGDMIEFTPSDFGPDAKEVVAKTVTLLLRPQTAR